MDASYMDALYKDASYTDASQIGDDDNCIVHRCTRIMQYDDNFHHDDSIIHG